MTKPVFSVTDSSITSMPQHIENAACKSTPKGISSSESSIQSDENQPRRTFKDSFFATVNRIKNFFYSIFYRIFYGRPPLTQSEIQYSEFQARLERVDALSEQLALKEAFEFPRVFTSLGSEVFEKSYNLFWKFYKWMDIKYYNGTYWKLGKDTAQKDYRTVLPHLQSYYQSQIQRLENQKKD